MIRLTYASTAIKEWSPEDLLKLLKECRTNNGAKNITGILLYSKGTFFQVWRVMKQLLTAYFI